ncbi:Crp/Fnr family transcriptional regulator [Methylopila musalis]|uniref:Crp/Fnr family transcriptional regulator n=1 Tax=Methylopila musalis TaxID=1134781 RepID=A0ABW3Z824_9HYPH
MTAALAAPLFPTPGLLERLRPHAAATALTGCDGCPARALAVCQALADADMDEFGAIGDQQRFAPKEALFRQGDDADAVFTITSGMVRLYRLLSDGRRQILGFLLPGDFIGLAPDERYASTAEAVTPVAACRFDARAYATLAERKPRLLASLRRAAADELAAAQDHMVLLGRRSADERVAAFLIALRQRLAVRGGGAVTIALPMSRQDLADHLGLTIETVSRVISRLARERVLLVVPDGVRVLDAQKLQALAAA